MRRIAEHQHRCLAEFKAHDRLLDCQHFDVIGQFCDYRRQTGLAVVCCAIKLVGGRVDEHRGRKHIIFFSQRDRIAMVFETPLMPAKPLFGMFDGSIKRSVRIVRIARRLELHSSRQRDAGLYTKT